MDKIGRLLFRCLTIVSLTLSLAILWGETRRQNVQDVLHGYPLEAMMVCGAVLLISSFFLVWFKHFRRLAIVGLIVSIWTLFVYLLPTV